MKIDKNKLLELYYEILIKKTLSKTYVIKKYGKGIALYLDKVKITDLASGIDFNKEKKLYFSLGGFLSKEISKIESYIALDKQNKVNKYIFFAISIQALTALISIGLNISLHADQLGIIWALVALVTSVLAFVFSIFMLVVGILK